MLGKRVEGKINSSVLVQLFAQALLGMACHSCMPAVHEPELALCKLRLSIKACCGACFWPVSLCQSVPGISPVKRSALDTNHLDILLHFTRESVGLP